MPEIDSTDEFAGEVPVAEPTTGTGPVAAGSDGSGSGDGSGREEGADGTEPAPLDAAAEWAERPVPVADEVLLAAVDLARAALLEVTPAETIGRPVGHVVEGEHVLSLLFECALAGYPGWHWTVSLSRIDDEAAPSVLEAELMPGDHALLAPEWVPWSERLADYRSAQELIEAEALVAAVGDVGPGESDDDIDDDDDDDDDDLHDVEDDDIDGVDIDRLGEHDDDEPDDDEPDDEPDDDADDDQQDEDEQDHDFDEQDHDFDEQDDDAALAAANLHDEQAGEPEPDADGAAPGPPAESGGIEFGAEDQKHDEGH
ncbi:DUF3027 domain-containing protein [Luethyella okanaganae]|uniref:DUF3027 domain-containing protein n=1 Tax=Luethyella okanaganae TaxID=69372 RepID=A0ABW1VG21_9MICO